MSEYKGITIYIINISWPGFISSYYTSQETGYINRKNPAQNQGALVDV